MRHARFLVALACTVLLAACASPSRSTLDGKWQLPQTTKWNQFQFARTLDFEGDKLTFAHYDNPHAPAIVKTIPIQYVAGNRFQATYNGQILDFAYALHGNSMNLTWLASGADDNVQSSSSSEISTYVYQRV